MIQIGNIDLTLWYHFVEGAGTMIVFSVSDLGSRKIVFLALVFCVYVAFRVELQQALQHVRDPQSFFSILDFLFQVAGIGFTYLLTNLNRGFRLYEGQND